MVATMVAAYVSNNKVDPDKIGDIFNKFYSGLRGIPAETGDVGLDSIGDFAASTGLSAFYKSDLASDNQPSPQYAIGLDELGQSVQMPLPLTPEQIARTITDDLIYCLDDGEGFQALRKHLSKLKMTPEQYRAKWNLPPDYPMVSPNYTRIRSQIAHNRHNKAK